MVQKGREKDKEEKGRECYGSSSFKMSSQISTFEKSQEVD